jgi:hypothetical protein
LDTTSVPITLTEQKVRNISFQVLADVYKNNTFSCDITNYIVSIDNIVSDLEFKQKGTILGKPSVNSSSISLDNTLGKFSPNNSNNIEADYPTGTFRTNTPIKILAGFIDETNTPQTRVLFYGVITSFKNKITRDSKQVVLQLKDHAKFLQKKKIPNHDLSGGTYYEAVLFDVTIDQAIDYLIDYGLGTSFSRTLHTLTEKLPVVEFTVGNSIWQTLQSLAQSVEGRIFFENGEFKFYTPLSSDWDEPLTSQYTFNADNIQDFQEDVDEDSIINKWKINSNPKTLQIRQVLCGTPSSNTISSVDEYWTGDLKSALGVDNKTFTLKSQEDDLSWIDSINVPLVDTQTYSDLIQLIPSPLQTDIDTMNNASLIKVWDRINNVQLTINDIDTKTGEIELLNEIDPENYNIQITYQYYQDQIVHGKYREYIYDLEKIGANIELPVIIANNIEESITYSTTTPTDTLYLSDWTIFEGNKRVKFKLTNNYPISGDANEFDTVYITKFEIWGNALECTSPLSFEAIDGTTINLFENSYEIINDYISNITWGKQLVDLYLYKYQNNLTFLDANTKGIPNIDLLDRVTIQEAISGNNSDYIVIGIKHSIKKDGWKTNLQLESLIPPWVYDPTRVNALFYKYGTSYLSFYSTITPANPTNFQVIEQTYVQTSGELITRVLVTFIPPLYSSYSHTLIQISDDNGLTWQDVGTSTDGKYYIYGLITGTTYKVRVLAVSINGQKSNALEKSITIAGKNTPPSDVANLTITQNDAYLKATIVLVDDPDVDEYELRMGPTLANSYKIIPNFPGPSVTFEAPREGTLTFWVRALDRSGLFSANAKKFIIDVHHIPPQNIIFTRTENLSTWTAQNMYFDSWGHWQILSDEIIEDYDDFFSVFESTEIHLLDTATLTLPIADLGENILQSDCYYIDPWGDLHLRSIDTINDYDDFFNMFVSTIVTLVTPQYNTKTFLGVNIDYDYQPNNRIDSEYRTRVDGDQWSSWYSTQEKQFIGRRIETKLLPVSLDGITNVGISSATLKVDVPDIAEEQKNINVTVAGVHITYQKRYYDTPIVTNLVTRDSNGVMATNQVTNESLTGCDVFILDSSGNPTTGTIKIIEIAGY